MASGEAPRHPKRPNPTCEAFAALTIASLPLDLVSVIIGFLPRHARLTVCSLVCKRWRVAAVRAINSFRIYSSQNAPPTLATLRTIAPNVTDLVLWLDESTWSELQQLPPTLRKLKLIRFGAGGTPPVGPLPDSIVSLMLGRSILESRLLCWLQQLRISLTKLDLSLLSELRTEEQEFFGAAHLPSLTHLFLTTNQPLYEDHIGAFLRRHSQQLVSLKLTLFVESTPDTPLSFPCLRKLSVARMSTGSVRLLLNSCPNLRRLKMQNCEAAPLLSLPKVQATLVHLLDCNAVELSSLLLCTRLERLQPEHLSMGASVVDIPRWATEIVPRLLVLHTEDFRTLQAAGMHLSRLRTLHIGLFLSTPLPQQPLYLPQVREIIVMCGDPDVTLPAGICYLATAMSHVRYLVDAAPRLRRLEIRRRLDLLTPLGVEQMIRFLHHLAALGVEEVILDSVASPRLKAAARSFGWMRVKFSEEREREVAADDSNAWEDTWAA